MLICVSLISHIESTTSITWDISIMHFWKIYTRIYFYRIIYATNCVVFPSSCDAKKSIFDKYNRLSAVLDPLINPIRWIGMEGEEGYNFVVYLVDRKRSIPTDDRSKREGTKTWRRPGNGQAGETMNESDRERGVGEARSQRGGRGRSCSNVSAGVALCLSHMSRRANWILTRRQSSRSEWDIGSVDHLHRLSLSTFLFVFLCNPWQDTLLKKISSIRRLTRVSENQLEILWQVPCSSFFFPQVASGCNSPSDFDVSN